MRRIISIIAFTIIIVNLYGQTESPIRMTSEQTENKELRDILYFEGIEYYKIIFVGEELRNKSYSIRAKEFKDGNLTLDTLIINTKSIGVPSLETINDTILNIRVIAKQTFENKLKIMFNFPGFSTTAREFELIETEDSYSLRNLAEESNLPINYDESFYLLAYILPYDLGNGFKSYCEVGQNGEDVENWGEKYGIKHYMLFEMKIE